MRAGTYPIKMNMRSLLIGIAALLLATGTAYAIQRKHGIRDACVQLIYSYAKKKRALMLLFRSSPVPLR